jgi:glycerate kinase
MAAASGIHLVKPEERNIYLASSFGTGQLINAALDHGCDKLIIGLGGSATNDGGMGMMKALGAQFLGEGGAPLAPDVRALLQLAKIDLQYLVPRLSKTEIVVACDVNNPLCGENGAAHVFGPQKGANTDQIKKIDAGLRNLDEVVKRDLGKDVLDVEGGGAAGGFGAGAMAFLNAELEPGIETILGWLEFEKHLQEADWVLTGEVSSTHPSPVKTQSAS